MKFEHKVAWFQYLNEQATEVIEELNKLRREFSRSTARDGYVNFEKMREKHEKDVASVTRLYEAICVERRSVFV